MASNIGVGSNTTGNGTIGADSIFGTGGPSLNDIIYGHMGNDTINGLAGAGEIDLSTIYGGQGDDSILVNSFDRVYGNRGDDSISSGTGSSSTLYGGQGSDTLVSNFFGTGGGNSNVYYGNLGDDSVDIVVNTSSVYGGQGNDTVFASGNGNLVHGNLGDDSLSLDSGTNSTMYGDGGNDAITGFANGSVLYGNLGNDSIANENNGTMYGGQGDDSITAGQLVTYPDGFRSTQGVATNDLLYGNLGNDILSDRSTSAATGSTMYGGQGNDTIVSVVANNDVMNGGLGSDLFVDSYGSTAALHTTTVSEFVTGTDQVSFGSGAGIAATTPAPSGSPTNFAAAQDNTVTDLTSATAAAVTLEGQQPTPANINYLFVAGANDGFLFYDGAGGSGAFNAEITLTGQNSIADLHSNDITGSIADQVPPALPSDVRVKRDITLLGRLASGLNLYRYRYTWSDEVYVGVMAQEVATVRPDAVVRGPDGMLRVIYERLGLKMQTWSQWTAARA